MRSLGGCAATSGGLILTAAEVTGRCAAQPLPRMRRTAKSPPASPLRAEESRARLVLVPAAERGIPRPTDCRPDAVFGTTPDHL